MRPGRAITHVILILGAVIMVGPFIWQILTAVKTQSESIAVPPVLWPADWQWSHFADLFTVVPFGSQLVNTIVMTVARTLGQVVLCSMAGYAFARLHFPGRNWLFALFLAILMVPSQLFLLPQYQIIQSLGWLNSLQALILPGLFSAFGTFLLRQFFLGLPDEIEEAARLDGCNPFQIYWRIMLPLAKPGLIALAVLTGLAAWNDLMWPLVVNNDPEKMSVSAGLATLQGQAMTNYPLLMAGATLASLPVLAVFAVMQKQFIAGVASSAVKG